MTPLTCSLAGRVIQASAHWHHTRHSAGLHTLNVPLLVGTTVAGPHNSAGRSSATGGVDTKCGTRAHRVDRDCVIDEL
jgi:hypothetical protein